MTDNKLAIELVRLLHAALNGGEQHPGQKVKVENLETKVASLEAAIQELNGKEAPAKDVRGERAEWVEDANIRIAGIQGRLKTLEGK